MCVCATIPERTHILLCEMFLSTANYWRMIQVSKDALHFPSLIDPQNCYSFLNTSSNYLFQCYVWTKCFVIFFLHLPSWTIMRKLSPQIWIRYLSISIKILLQFDWNMHVLTLTFVSWPLFYFICTFFHVNFEVIKVAILQEFDQNKSDNCLTWEAGDVFEKQSLL